MEARQDGRGDVLCSLGEASGHKQKDRSQRSTLKYSKMGKKPDIPESHFRQLGFEAETTSFDFRIYSLSVCQQHADGRTVHLAR